MRLRRRDIIPLLLFAYVTLMAALSLPGNDAIPTADKVIVVIISYTHCTPRQETLYASRQNI